MLYEVITTIAGNIKSKSTIRTGFGATFETANTGGAVRRLINSNLNRTNPVTCTALCTFIRIKFQPNQADPVEQAIKSP